MTRVFIAAWVLACACIAEPFEPSEDQIARHRDTVFNFARDYVVDTFNLVLLDEGKFNPVRLGFQGVWGSFDTRMKELGGDRFEVQGWVKVAGLDDERIHWTVHIKYRLEDPQAWMHRRIDRVYNNEPEFLGWMFGDYWSPGYDAPYEPEYFSSR